MLRRSFRKGLVIGLLVGAVIAARRLLQRDDLTPALDAPSWPPMQEAAQQAQPPMQEAAPAAEPPLATEPAAEPPRAPEPVSQPVAKEQATPAAAPAKKAPAKKAAAPKAQPVPAWVEPVEGACPSTHPVKGKLSSKLFHLPGMFAYERTRPDRCYLDAAAAEADGLTRAKR